MEIRQYTLRVVSTNFYRHPFFLIPSINFLLLSIRDFASPFHASLFQSTILWHRNPEKIEIPRKPVELHNLNLNLEYRVYTPRHTTPHHAPHVATYFKALVWSRLSEKRWYTFCSYNTAVSQRDQGTALRNVSLKICRAWRSLRSTYFYATFTTPRKLDFYLFYLWHDKTDSVFSLSRPCKSLFACISNVSPSWHSWHIADVYSNVFRLRPFIQICNFIRVTVSWKTRRTIFQWFNGRE